MGPIVKAVTEAIDFAIGDKQIYDNDYDYLVDKWKVWLSGDVLIRAHYVNWGSCDVKSNCEK
jgi:hypothetical protein